MWDYEDDWDFEYTFVNNRKAYHGYDFDGREVSDPRTNADGNAMLFAYDAAGQMWKTERYYSGYETTFGRDGTGQELKRSQRIYDPVEEEWGEWESSYFINSTVLGQTVSETTSTGKKKFTYVIGAGNVIARQAIDDGDDEYVSWEHRDASGFSSRASTASSIPTEVTLKPEEMDALGNNVGTAPALTIAPRGNATSPNEPTAFDDPNAGDCNFSSYYGPCSVIEALEYGSGFFADNHAYPFQIGERTNSARSNPAYMYYESMRFFFPDFDTFTRVDPTRDTARPEAGPQMAVLGRLYGFDDDLDKIYATPPCDVAKYDALSKAQKALIGQEAYEGKNGLTQLQRAVFVNITGQLERAGVNLDGLKLQTDGVLNDRLFFTPESTAGLKASIQALTKSQPKAFDSKPWPIRLIGHKGMTDFMVRQTVSENSLQVGFGKKGAYADIDLWNPDYEFGKHQDEIRKNDAKKGIVTPHFYIAKVLGNCKN